MQILSDRDRWKLHRIMIEKKTKLQKWQRRDLAPELYQTKTVQRKLYKLNFMEAN